MRRCLLGMMFVIAVAALANAQDQPVAQSRVNGQADPIWDGALVGAGVVAVASQFVYPHAKNRIQLAAAAALVGAGWGAWFDYTIKDRTTIRWTARSVSITVKLK